MDMKMILEGRHEHSEHTEAIMRIWRSKPSSSADAKRYYEFNEGYFIEDKLDEVNILKIKLPLLSKKSIHTIPRDDIVIDEPTPLNARHSSNAGGGLSGNNTQS